MQFLIVYVREAHAIDSPVPMPAEDQPIVEDPLTLEERNRVAQACLKDLRLEPIPAVVDGLDDAVAEAYAARPDRLYLIGLDGKVAFQGGPGPFGFDPAALERAIEDL